MNKYDLGVKLINDLISIDEIGDNDEGIISIYELCELMNEKFSPFFDAFSNSILRSKIRTALSRADVEDIHYFDLDKVVPFFSKDGYVITFSNECDTIVFGQEKEDDCCYCNPRRYGIYDSQRLLSNFNELIHPLFNLMREYDLYGNFLNSNDKKEEYSLSFEQDGFKGSIYCDTDNKFKCDFNYADISAEFTEYIWDNGRLPLAWTLGKNKEEISKRIPIDVNKLDQDNIFKITYDGSKTLEKSKQVVYVSK